MAEYTAITPDGKYLLHYGTKGMKWGKNKKKSQYKMSSNRKATDREDPKDDNWDYRARTKTKDSPLNDRKTWSRGKSPTGGPYSPKKSSLRKMSNEQGVKPSVANGVSLKTPKNGGFYGTGDSNATQDKKKKKKR